MLENNPTMNTAAAMGPKSVQGQNGSHDVSIHANSRKDPIKIRVIFSFRSMIPTEQLSTIPELSALALMNDAMIMPS